MLGRHTADYSRLGCSLQWMLTDASTHAEMKAQEEDVEAGGGEWHGENRACTEKGSINVTVVSGEEVGKSSGKVLRKYQPECFQI